MQKKETGPLIPLAKISSKWIKHLNIRHETPRIKQKKSLISVLAMNSQISNQKHRQQKLKQMGLH